MSSLFLGEAHVSQLLGNKDKNSAGTSAHLRSSRSQVYHEHVGPQALLFSKGADLQEQVNIVKSLCLTPRLCLGCLSQTVLLRNSLL